MAPNLAGQRPSKSPSLTPATNSRHSLRPKMIHTPSGSTELRTITILPRIPISTHAPLSHPLVARHVGSSADLPLTTSPNGYQTPDHL
jgi:hypothetical protein